MKIFGYQHLKNTPAASVAILAKSLGPSRPSLKFFRPCLWGLHAPQSLFNSINNPNNSRKIQSIQNTVSDKYYHFTSIQSYLQKNNISMHTEFSLSKLSKSTLKGHVQSNWARKRTSEQSTKTEARRQHVLKNTIIQ